MMKYSMILLLILLIQITQQRSKDEWKSRTIYQVLTDRFERGDGQKPGCDLHNYCGGNYAGMINRLDYLQNLGFDAIWISPPVDNHDGGYHGYWARNMYEMNSHFGTKDDLKNFVNECHKRDIWVMVDVVGNHMGNTDQNYGSNYPFNDAAHYHNYCIIQGSDFSSHNMHNLQYCRLAGLADLNQENAWVYSELTKWINWLVTEFKFDGIRIDTVIEVPTGFWKSFTQSSGVFSIGEAFDGDYGLVASFVGPLDSVLNYPQFFVLKDVFLHQKDMTDVKNYYNSWGNSVGQNNLQYMGNFNDNHDNARFLSNDVNNNLTYDSQHKFVNMLKASQKLIQFKAFTAFTLCSLGIPIIYYGSEQAFGGGNDPYNREVMWNNFDQNHEMYKFIKTINDARKSTGAPSQPHTERYVDSEIYAFTRGKLFAAFSSKLSSQVHKVITYHGFSEGQSLCNIFYPTTDCIKVVGGKFDLYLNYGEVKIFIPV